MLTTVCEDARLTASTAERALETAKERSSELEKLVATLSEDLDKAREKAEQADGVRVRRRTTCAELEARVAPLLQAADGVGYLVALQAKLAALVDGVDGCPGRAGQPGSRGPAGQDGLGSVLPEAQHGREAPPVLQPPAAELPRPPEACDAGPVTLKAVEVPSPAFASVPIPAKGQGKRRNRASKHSQREHKPFTPEKEKLLAGDRNIIGVNWHTGEVRHVAKSYMWVRPLGPMPSEILSELSQDSEGELKLYVSTADIVEDGLVLVAGTMVLFQLYKGSKGVGSVGLPQLECFALFCCFACPFRTLCVFGLTH